jgi:hypothetical protein
VPESSSSSPGCCQCTATPRDCPTSRASSAGRAAFCRQSIHIARNRSRFSRAVERCTPMESRFRDRRHSARKLPSPGPGSGSSRYLRPWVPQQLCIDGIVCWFAALDEHRRSDLPTAGNPSGPAEIGVGRGIGVPGAGSVGTPSGGGNTLPWPGSHTESHRSTTGPSHHSGDTC